MKLNDINNIEKLYDNLILAKIINKKGSAPRNKNVFMIISFDKNYGTIGGGELEYRVIKESIKLLRNKEKKEKLIQYPLGPSLGQCCGGYVKIKFKKFDTGINLLKEMNLKEKIINENENLYIFGAGHVSKALLSKLDGVGFNVFVIDSRESFLKDINLDYINKIFARNPEIIIKNAPPKSYYIVLTHSHQIDLLICSSILKINNFSFIGLIGSNTKKIRFNKKLTEIGYDKDLINKIECPIGISDIEGKEPDVIAISIIARLLQYKSSIIDKQKLYLKLIKS